MRTWNFVKLNDISYQVTELATHKRKSASRHVLAKTTAVALVLGVVLGTAQSARASEVLIPFGATPNITTALIDSPDTSQLHPAPFADEFADFETDEFLEAHSDILVSIAKLGSALDDHRSSEGVVLALQANDDGTGKHLDAEAMLRVMSTKRKVA